MTAVKLKPASEHRDDVCDASRCQRASEIILEQAAAKAYGRQRVEFCDRDYTRHCEAGTGSSSTKPVQAQSSQKKTLGLWKRDGTT